VRLESHGTEDWVKVMCGGLRSETEERKKRGRKVRAGSAHAKVKEDGEGGLVEHDTWGSSRMAQGPWRATLAEQDAMAGAAPSRDIRGLTRGPKWHGGCGPQWRWLLGWPGERENGPSPRRIVTFSIYSKNFKKT
jgi:hypothetical protein